MIISKRLKYILLGLGIAVILLLGYLISSNIKLRVSSVNPSDKTANVNVNTQIRVSFSKPVDPGQVKIEFSPSLGFRIIAQNANKDFILIPDYQLNSNTNYQLIVKSPVGFKSSFTTLDLPPEQQIGQGYSYKSGFERAVKEGEKLADKYDVINKFTYSLPITKPTFSVRFVPQTLTYIVKSEGGSSTEQAKQDFNNYLNQQGVNPKDINVVINTHKSDFFVISNDLDGKEVGSVQPLKIYFSDPVDYQSTLIEIDPYVPAYYDWNQSFTSVTITPTQGWGFGRDIKVVVKGVGEDKKGVALGEDYVYTFKARPYSGI